MGNERFDSGAENFQMASSLDVYSTVQSAKFSGKVNFNHFFPACREPFSQWKLLYCSTP